MKTTENTNKEWFLPINPELLKRKDITSTQKLILGYMIYRSNLDGWTFNPTDIEKNLGLSRWTIYRELEKLEKIGQIKMVGFSGSYQTRYKKYVLTDVQNVASCNILPECSILQHPDVQNVASCTSECSILQQENVASCNTTISKVKELVQEIPNIINTENLVESLEVIVQTVNNIDCSIVQDVNNNCSACEPRSITKEILLGISNKERSTENQVESSDLHQKTKAALFSSCSLQPIEVDPEKEKKFLALFDSTIQPSDVPIKKDITKPLSKAEQWELMFSDNKSEIEETNYKEELVSYPTIQPVLSKPSKFNGVIGLGMNSTKSY